MVSDARDARASEGGDGRIAGFSRLLGGSSPEFRSTNSIPTLFCKISYKNLSQFVLCLVSFSIPIFFMQKDLFFAYAVLLSNNVFHWEK